MPRPERCWGCGAFARLEAEVEWLRVATKTYRLSSEQREAKIQSLTEVIGRLLYRAGPITDATPCRCGATQPAHACSYREQAIRDALAMVPDA